jgi:deoxycytidylate deaminase
MSSKHKAYIEEAIKEANKSCMFRKHGCVIVNNKEIISKGYNYYIYNLIQKFSVHAEESAILKLKKLNNYKNNTTYTMYVVRISDNFLRISLPCNKCKKIIEKIKCIKTIYYSCD